MRKVLSFVLVLTLVLSSFSMAFAADTTTAAAGLTDIAGNANADAIQVAYDLEIVTGNPDGTFLPAKAVNRAEFAAMLTRALDIPASALAGYTTTSFKDTAGYTWAVPYLAFCQSKGILLGDGAGNVMPGKTITVNEAMTMALRAIGYTANSSLLVGAWPANYVSIAQNEDMYDDVASTTTVDKASAAQIIYNLLTVQKVAVNTDGETIFQTTKEDGATVEANLLNTNLGCTSHSDEILGDTYNYENSLINITGNLGAFGTAYANSDDDLVAFTVDSTALTGKIDGTKFKVGDTKYDIEDATTNAAIFNNADASFIGNAYTTAPGISAAAVNTDDGKTVTLNVDLSGKKIKDVYSVVAWDADQKDLAASDVQEDIADKELLSEDFAQDDNDNIDMTSFQLVGVASLDKIAKDNVVYVYVDGDNDIRKVAVGTETVTGVVEETDDDTITIAGKDYDIAANSSLTIPSDVDVDSEGTFYLDVNGEVFDFEGTSGTVDTYAVVKAYDDGSNIDSARLKLYLSEDATKTYEYSDDPEDLDWTTTTGAYTTTFSALSGGALVGYALDADGMIDTLDISAKAYTVNTSFQSAKVMTVNGATKDVNSNAVVFTYKTTTAAFSDYDVAKLSDVKKGAIASVASPASIILNDDDEVVAIFIEEDYVDVEDNDVYGVFNTRNSAKTGDDDVYKFVGYIDGTEFTKKTDDRANEYNNKAGVFGVYKITVDANDVITAVATQVGTYVQKTSSTDGASGEVLSQSVITDVNSDKTVITIGGTTKYTIDDKATVYKFDDSDDEYTVSKLSALRTGYTVALYDTKGDDADGVATVVIYIED